MLKIEGQPIAAAAVQPRYRLSILPGRDPDERLLRAEILLGESAVLPHPLISRFLQFSRVRVSQPLRANKRRSVLCAAFIEMLAAPTSKEAQGAIARAARHADIDRHHLRHEVRDLLQANLLVSRQKSRALVLDGERWVTAPVELRRELELYRVPFAVFGWEIFREMPDVDLMRVPAETLQARLPLLLEALDAAGIELHQGGLPVRGAVWEFSFDARRKEGIDWFEIRPEIRCDGRLLGARDMKRILKGGGTVEIDGQLRVVDAASREVLALLGGVRGGSAAKKGGNREIVRGPPAAHSRLDPPAAARRRGSPAPGGRGGRRSPAALRAARGAAAPRRAAGDAAPLSARGLALAGLPLRARLRRLPRRRHGARQDAAGDHPARRHQGRPGARPGRRRAAAAPDRGPARACSSTGRARSASSSRASPSPPTPARSAPPTSGTPTRCSRPTAWSGAISRG